jgi:hypothetical protein
VIFHPYESGHQAAFEPHAWFCQVAREQTEGIMKQQKVPAKPLPGNISEEGKKSRALGNGW